MINIRFLVTTCTLFNLIYEFSKSLNIKALNMLEILLYNR